MCQYCEEPFETRKDPVLGDGFWSDIYWDKREKCWVLAESSSCYDDGISSIEYCPYCGRHLN